MSTKVKNIVLYVLTLSASMLILTIVIFSLIYSNFYVEMTLNGSAKVVVPYGEDYQDEGATAVLRNRFTKTAVPLKIKEIGIVDSSRPGTYELCYTSHKYSSHAEKKRTVVVEDREAPKLELFYKDGYITKAGTSYVEEGYTAFDNYDGDITDKVTSYERDGVVYYSVTDSSGNTATAQREIRYWDTENPMLELLGDAEITITAGGTYTEPGWRAVDDRDGDLSDRVVVSGTVDPYRAGTYRIEYTVADADGNEASAVRTVEVCPIRQAETVNPGDKVVYLTFDDGPSAYTQQLLDVLELYNVKATFFTTSASPRYRYLIGEAARAGHTVAIHTATHVYSQVYASEDAYFEDLRTQASVIEEETGTWPMLVRFPGGSSNKVSRNYCVGIMTALTQAVQDQGYQYFDWNVASGDAGETTDTDQVFQNVINGIKQHNVSTVLQHDTHKFSVDAVERIIIWGLENGYTFLPLDETSPAVHHRLNN